MKGDSLERSGDSRGAAAHYRAALRASPPADQLPPDLQQEMRRVQQANEQFSRRYDEHMRSWLKQKGVDAAPQGDTRLAQSLDILLGRQRIFLQEPRYFYFPQLSQQPFFDRAAFPWLDALEAAVPAIRAELDALLQDPDGFHAVRPGRPHACRGRPAAARRQPGLVRLPPVAQRRVERSQRRALSADAGRAGRRAARADAGPSPSGAVLHSRRARASRRATA